MSGDFGGDPSPRRKREDVFIERAHSRERQRNVALGSDWLPPEWARPWGQSCVHNAMEVLFQAKFAGFFQESVADTIQ